MNYDELIDLIGKNVPTTWFSRENAIASLDEAIDTLDDRDIGEAIATFCRESNVCHSQDAVFARELIDYIEGLKENQDNGEPKSCCKFNGKSIWHHDFDCKNFVTCD